MPVGIDEDDVFGPSEAGDGGEIGLIAGGEDDRVRAAHKGGDFGFERAMGSVSAVGDARARGPGTQTAQRRAAGFDALGIEGKTEIVVGADQDRAPPADGRLAGTVKILDLEIKGIGPGAEELAAPLGQELVFVEDVHLSSVLRAVARRDRRDRPTSRGRRSR